MVIFDIINNELILDKILGSQDFQIITP